ncbi:hypothetical protein SO802_005288 [Lithocarpus litseifolius]|uniref:Uncharacterized protein n=1 Tax=Lithocarpus litseifolius TaxID=425828 RepID=A0AAW2DM03_9ROSI
MAEIKGPLRQNHPENPIHKLSFMPSTPPKGSSVLAQSVPDFSATLRKENRKPNSRGSKSANAGEKRGVGGGLMARKSYASVEELKGLSLAAANAINSENRGGRNGRVVGKVVLGYRQF